LPQPAIGYEITMDGKLIIMDGKIITSN